MDTNLLHGKLVHLTAEEPKLIAEAIIRWDRDSEFHRLLDDSPTIHTVKGLTEWIQKAQEKDAPSWYLFGIRTLEGDRLIGFTDLEINSFSQGEAFVGIGIGERDCWGRGYGTDAMEVVLRFAFQELNLHRVSLDTFEYNPRAIRSYEKAGFVHEGRARKSLLREGKRWDMLYMGILRDEWLVKNG